LSLYHPGPGPLCTGMGRPLTTLLPKVLVLLLCVCNDASPVPGPFVDYCPRAVQPLNAKFHSTAGRQGCCMFGTMLKALDIIRSLEMCKKYRKSVRFSKAVGCPAVSDITLASDIQRCCELSAPGHASGCHKAIAPTLELSKTMMSTIPRCSLSNVHLNDCDATEQSAAAVVQHLAWIAGELYSHSPQDMPGAVQTGSGWHDMRQILGICTHKNPAPTPSPPGTRRTPRSARQAASICT
jgi:hypothetical protein